VRERDHLITPEHTFPQHPSLAFVAASYQDVLRSSSWGIDRHSLARCSSSRRLWVTGFNPHECSRRQETLLVVAPANMDTVFNNKACQALPAYRVRLSPDPSPHDKLSH